MEGIDDSISKIDKTISSFLKKIKDKLSFVHDSTISSFLITGMFALPKITSPIPVPGSGSLVKISFAEKPPSLSERCLCPLLKKDYKINSLRTGY
jgi:hypothetical protein